MFLVFYVIVFAFHPNLNLETVIVAGSFGHSLEKLVNIGYLTRKMVK